MTTETITPADVRRAIDELFATLLANPELITAAYYGPRPLEIDWADDWSADEANPRRGVAAIYSAILAHDHKPYTAESIIDWLRRATPRELDPVGPMNADDAAAYLRNVQRIPAPQPLGVSIEQIRAAAHAEPAPRLDLDVWRRDLCEHEIWDDDDAQPAALDSRANVCMAALASTPRQTAYLIPGVLAQGQGTLIFGHEKSGKTSLGGIDLCVALTTATPYLVVCPREVVTG